MFPTRIARLALWSVVLLPPTAVLAVPRIDAAHHTPVCGEACVEAAAARKSPRKATPPRAPAARATPPAQPQSAAPRPDPTPTRDGGY